MKRRPALAIVVAAAAGVLVAGAVGARSRVGTVERARGDEAIAPPATLFTAHGGPVAPGEPPRGLPGTEPGDCAGCHAEIAAEWASSAHARSWTDPVFQSEYRTKPEAFCRRCHAPLLPEGATDEPTAARGIDCAVCHVREGHVLGAHGRGGDDHVARRDARLATSAFCGGCHQFDFPEPAPGERVHYHPGRPLQDTLAEHARSRYADRPCQHCHMPLAGAPGKQHRSHAFRTLDDPAFMARAVRVTAEARRHGRMVRVTVEIAPGEIGHAFPTGDMFREAVLTVRAGAAHGREVLRRYFAQTITADRRGHLLGQVDDTRIPPPGTGPAPRFEFELDDPHAAEVTWSLELFRLPPAAARRRGLDDAAIRVPTSSGRLPIAPAGP